MTRTTRKKRLAWTGSVLLVVLGWIALDRLTRPILIAGPVVQMLTPDAASLVWQVSTAKPAGFRLLGPDGRPAGAVSPLGTGGVRITGLAPKTAYTYSIHAGSLLGEVTLRRGAFRTAPPPGSAIRFIALGDSGDGGADQQRIAARLLDEQPDLVIHTGDLIYDRGEQADYQLSFYQPYAELLARVPFYPALGNHDLRNSEIVTQQGQPFKDAFMLPENGPAGLSREHEYWFDFGHARFVAVDSNRDFETLAGRVAPWLDEVLASAGDRWKFVFFHHPPYTGALHPPDEGVRKALVPVIDKWRVDVVFSGHNHLYERTHPLRAGRTVEPGQGTVYIVTGAGGAGLYREKIPVPGTMASWYDVRHSFTVVDVDNDQLRVRQINDRGERVDAVVLTRGQAVVESQPGI